MFPSLLPLLLLSLPLLTSASPRPLSPSPASLLDLVDEAAEWTFSMKPRISAGGSPSPGRLPQGEEGRQGQGLVVQSGDGGGTVRTMTKWDFTDCGLPTDAISIKSLDVSPDPPEAGKKLTIEAAGTVHTLIDDGAYADVVVKLGTYIKLLQKRFDVCEELEKANATLQCPIAPGDYTLIQSVDLPKEIPKAKFTVDTRAFTQEEDDMACATIVIDFMRS